MSDLLKRLDKVLAFDIYKTLKYFSVNDPTRDQMIIKSAAMAENARTRKVVEAMRDCSEFTRLFYAQTNRGYPTASEWMALEDRGRKAFINLEAAVAESEGGK